MLDNENEKYNAVPYITKYLPEGAWGLYYHYENHPDCGPIGKYTTKGFTLGLNDGWSGGEIHFKYKDISFAVKPGNNDPDYAIWVAELGGIDITLPDRQTRIEQAYNSGLLFTSSTDKT